MNREDVVPLLGLVVGCITLIVVFAQMRIAATKVKLDLYNKRFAVYQSALDLYQATWNWNYEAIQPIELEFIKSFRESQFLFDEGDGIYNVLEKIKDCIAAIKAYENLSVDDNSASGAKKSDKDYRLALHERSVKARKDFEEYLLIIEKMLRKYLYFRSIEGWQVF